MKTNEIKNEMKTNFWAKLAELGIRYQKDVVMDLDDTFGRLAFKGQRFNTAKEIFEFVTK